MWTRLALRFLEQIFFVNFDPLIPNFGVIFELKDLFRIQSHILPYIIVPTILSQVRKRQFAALFFQRSAHVYAYYAPPKHFEGQKHYPGEKM